MAKFSLSDQHLKLPKGFLASGVRCGLKRVEGKKDLGILFSTVPAAAAGMFTTNVVRAASVDWDKDILRNQSTVRAIVVNAGNANACTGEAGARNVTETARIVAGELKVTSEEVLVASTGVIGVPLDMEKMRKGIHDAAQTLRDSEESATHFSESIITTDLVTKTSTVELQLEGKPVRITGFTKGSGMIHPNMATMLAFVVTDAAISSKALHQLLRDSVEGSFNQITVDGDTSTNDMILIMANGQAGNGEIQGPDSPGYGILRDGMKALCVELAKKIARDGEGATKLVEVRVQGASSLNEARMIGRTVVGSSLVKSALFGKDPNWGRIAAAAGRAGVDFNPDLLEITMNGIDLMKNGTPLPFDRQEASKSLESENVLIEINLHQGKESASSWGCDLTYDYVKINAEYFT